MSLSAEQLSQLRQMAEGVATREGCRLYDLEFVARALRVYIERAEGQVSLDDCANVSRGLNLLLDVEDVIPGGHYDLEVSSPGLERKLTQLWHFEKAIGQIVQIRFRDSAGQMQNYEGRLSEVKGSTLVFENKKGNFEVGFEDIERARTLFMEVKQGKPGKKGPSHNKR